MSLVGKRQRRVEGNVSLSCCYLSRQKKIKSDLVGACGNIREMSLGDPGDGEKADEKGEEALRLTSRNLTRVSRMVMSHIKVEN